MRRPTILALFAVSPLLAFACVGEDPVSAPPSTTSEAGTSGGNDGSVGGNDGGTTSDAPVGRTDVSGTVLTDFDAPVAGVVVRIEDATATTDANGKFTLKANPSYDVTLVYPSSGTSSGKAVLVVQGVQARTPTFRVEAGADRQATSVTVNVTGGTLPLGANEYVALLFAPTSHAASTGKFLLPGSVGSTTGTLSWRGDTPNTGDLYAYRFVTPKAGAPPTSITTSGKVAYSITENGTSTYNVTLSGSAGQNIQGTIDFNGSTASTLGYAIRTSGLHGLTTFDFAFTGTSFNLPLPGFLNARGAVSASGKTATNGTVTAWKTDIAGGTTNAALRVPAGIDAKSPANGATGVDRATSFSWDKGSAEFGVYELRVMCLAGFSVSYQASILTTNTAGALPDADGLGAPIPGNAGCTWTATALTAKGVDDLVTPAGWLRFTGLRFATADGVSSVTASRDFTTK